MLYQHHGSNTRCTFSEIVCETASLLSNRMMENMQYGQERLKDIAEKEAEEEAKEWQQEEEDIDLTPYEQERALKGAYRTFWKPVAPKTDIDSYFDQTKPHIKTLIKNQLKEIGSAKIIMTIWVRWKKPIMALLELSTEDAENAQEINGNTGDTASRWRCHLTAWWQSFLRVMISMSQCNICLHISRHKLRILECLRVVLCWIKYWTCT